MAQTTQVKSTLQVSESPPNHLLLTNTVEYVKFKLATTST
jgi:hypothetical protein